MCRKQGGVHLDREFRFRPAGMVFYLVLALNLLLTQTGLDLVRDLQLKTDIPQAVAAIFATGILLFTSDSVGYLFTSLVVFHFNARGGYSRDYRTRLGYRDFKQRIIDYYFNDPHPIAEESKHKRFEEQWLRYSEEAFMAYFFWHLFQDNPLDDWFTRRFSAYFAGLSAALAIVIGLALSMVLTCAFQMHWTPVNTWVTAVSLLFCIVLGSNAVRARRDTWPIVDLWVAGILNPRIRSIRDHLRQPDKERVTAEQLTQAKSLEGAPMPDGTNHE